MLQLIKLSPNLGIIWRMVKVSLWLKQEGAKPADFRAKIYIKDKTNQENEANCKTYNEYNIIYFVINHNRK